MVQMKYYAWFTEEHDGYGPGFDLQDLLNEGMGVDPCFGLDDLLKAKDHSDELSPLRHLTEMLHAFRPLFRADLVEEDPGYIRFATFPFRRLRIYNIPDGLMKVYDKKHRKIVLTFNPLTPQGRKELLLFFRDWYHRHYLRPGPDSPPGTGTMLLARRALQHPDESRRNILARQRARVPTVSKLGASAELADMSYVTAEEAGPNLDTPTDEPNMGDTIADASIKAEISSEPKAKLNADTEDASSDPALAEPAIMLDTITEEADPNLDTLTEEPKMGEL